ncbi:MAG: TetR/AcrR family transcriptional regulator [Marmoricola sp.]
MTAEPISIEAARRDMYRRQILNAAEVEFSRSGFANTKVNAIAKTADLSLATVYKNFGGKTEIWDSLHASRMEELLERVEAEGDSTDGPLDRILTGVASVARYLTEHPTYLAMNLWAGTGWASSDRTAHGVQETVWSAGLDTMAAGVKNAITAGEIPPIDPRVAAGLIVSTMQVWLAAWADGEQASPDDLVAAMTERLRWMLAGPR